MKPVINKPQTSGHPVDSRVLGCMEVVPEDRQE
jgi:hypothetical protein